MSLSTLTSSIPYVISLAAVIGAFYGIHYTNRINIQLQNDRLQSEERLKNREMLRSKGEQLILLVSDFENEFRRNSCALTGYLNLNGRNGYGNAAQFNKSFAYLKNIEMLTKVYFPSAVPMLVEVIAHRGHLGKYMIALTEATSKDEVVKITGLLIVLGMDVQETSSKLQQEVIRVLQELHADLNYTPKEKP